MLAELYDVRPKLVVGLLFQHFESRIQPRVFNQVGNSAKDFEVLGGTKVVAVAFWEPKDCQE
jgi:hypothetical protein